MNCLRHQEHGSSLVEFSLILPLFLMLLLGMADLGQGFNTYISMLNATREGAIWLAKRPSDITGMNNRIGAELEHVGVTREAIIISRTPQKASYAPGDLVTLTLEYSHELMFGAVTGMPAITLHTEHTIRIQ
ncbi:MAG: TadE/TadG family type IV pilus assembly protein [Caldilineaceae bacterium]